MLIRKSFFIILYFISVTFFVVLLKYTIFFSDLLCFFCSDDNVQNVYDYIIVGGGSAGAIIANRLANDKNNKILVLEAGRWNPELLHIPSVGILLQKTPFDWNYETVPQKNACLALDQNVSTWPMGKVLGGTSMLNNMLYVRGHQDDFDDWFKDKENYDYLDVLAYFRRLENHDFQENQDNENMEKSMYVQDLIFTTSLPNILLKAAESLGFPILEHNIDSKIGFGAPKANLHKGKRWTSANKLKENSNPNLHIKLNRLVEKVLFKSNYEAYGVKYSYYGKKYTARANKAVILSAGVIGSPKILMLSGIGKRDHLDKLGIKTMIDLPVGDNLQDHLTTGFGLILLNKTLELDIESMLSISSVLQYFVRGTGPWTTTGRESRLSRPVNSKVLTVSGLLCRGLKVVISPDVISLNGVGAYRTGEHFALYRTVSFDVCRRCRRNVRCELMAFFDTKNDCVKNNSRPNLQFMVMPLGITEDNGMHLRKLMGISDRIWSDYFSKIEQPTMTILPVLLHPKSRGTVRLASTDPLAKPVIDPQYLTDPEDVSVLISGIEIIKNLVNTEELAALGAKFNTNMFPACASYTFDTKDYWECYIRHLTMTSYHPIGTCKMGPFEDRSSVVDFNFQVKGTNKLFVVDGSVLPTLTSGNVNGAIMMMAEMASDVLKMLDYLSWKKCGLKDLFIPESTC